jgi:hypothetical protein
MAQLIWETLKEWGMETPCVQDYHRYVAKERNEDSLIPRLKSNEYFAGMVIFDEDNEKTVSSFIHMCKCIHASIICIDFSNITRDGTKEAFLNWINDELHFEMSNVYVNLNSYENCFCLGLDTFYRGEPDDEIHFIQIED